MRLIDADELIKKAIPKNPEAQFRCVSVNDIINAPTIETQPERTGRWCFNTDGKLVCSNCYETPTNRILLHADMIFDMTPIREKMKYCPNCGCRMLKEGEE